MIRFRIAGMALVLALAAGLASATYAQRPDPATQIQTSSTAQVLPDPAVNEADAARISSRSVEWGGVSYACRTARDAGEQVEVDLGCQPLTTPEGWWQAAP